MVYQCPVCGFDQLKSPPWGPDGRPSYEICKCCGFEFGVDDSDRGYSYDQYRRKWLIEGCPWFDESLKPEQWEPLSQLARLGCGIMGPDDAEIVSLKKVHRELKNGLRKLADAEKPWEVNDAILKLQSRTENGSTLLETALVDAAKDLGYVGRAHVFLDAVYHVITEILVLRQDSVANEEQLDAHVRLARSLALEALKTS